MEIALTNVCFAGKADMERTCDLCLLVTQSGHSRGTPEANGKCSAYLLDHRASRRTIGVSLKPYCTALPSKFEKTCPIRALSQFPSVSPEISS
jgi:hypothetical protein